MPKAELHLHLEGSIEPPTVVELAARHSVTLTVEEAWARYDYRDFLGFLEAFKWVSSFLRTPADYALIAERLAERLLAQNVLYAEVTIAGGVLLYRHQDLHAIFAAVRDVAAAVRKKGLRLQWVIDATRQFGAAAAMEVVRQCVPLLKEGVVAFGLGGDELAVPTTEFRPVYDFAAANGLRRLVHAGEVGGPDSVREAVELLGAERIGHGIAAIRDPGLMDLLTERRIPLEVCPTSNLCTGALARLLSQGEARIQDHPLQKFLRHGMPVTLSTDDPAMFHTELNGEYALAAQMGLRQNDIVRLAEMSFEFAFLPASEKTSLLAEFRSRTAALGLL
jgi:aminodeoxyfutalosine deaminase